MRSFSVIPYFLFLYFYGCMQTFYVNSLFQHFGRMYHPLTQTNNLLITINSSVNFIIYCIFGEKFQRIFFKMFCSLGGLGTQSELLRYPSHVHREVGHPVPLLNGQTHSYQQEQWFVSEIFFLFSLAWIFTNRYCQNPTLTQLNSTQSNSKLGLRLDIVASWNLPTTTTTTHKLSSPFQTSKRAEILYRHSPDTPD